MKYWKHFRNKSLKVLLCPCALIEGKQRILRGEIGHVSF
jgi:hypothetical protein